MSELKKWDVVDYLHNEKDYEGYLKAVMEEDDPQLLAAALGDVARARSIAATAKDAGVTRTSLYKSLSKTGNPSYKTVQKVLKSLGFELTLKRIR